MTARTDPELMIEMTNDGDTPLQAIVTAIDGLDDLLAQLPPGIRVDHTYSLIGSICVTARPRDLRQLISMPVVKSIEPVRPVQHW